ncbi:hypothetical protein LTS14_008334 [Recurvomyces mirabilis]|uniref:uncharacterized protein n=1 Tax=Recurvomyces mirabilis TaxID=574656 RepID=UPI002DE110B1|nr:hypothetical protein LTS14_008334 [Recurvomyces mirabilis]
MPKVHTHVTFPTSSVPVACNQKGWTLVYPDGFAQDIGTASGVEGDSSPSLPDPDDPVSIMQQFFAGAAEDGLEEPEISLVVEPLSAGANVEDDEEEGEEDQEEEEEEEEEPPKKKKKTTKEKATKTTKTTKTTPAEKKAGPAPKKKKTPASPPASPPAPVKRPRRAVRDSAPADYYDDPFGDKGLSLPSPTISSLTRS